MPTALIADDEPHLARRLQDALAATWPELEIVAVARHGVEAAERIAALRPDVAFLDIKMPGLSGLEVAQGIEVPTHVVFVTAYDAYAVSAFEHEALDYLLKPVTDERLAKTVQRVRKAIESRAPGSIETDDARLGAALHRLLSAPAAAGAPLRWILASRGDVTHQLPVDDVLFFRADDKYTVVHTVAAEHLIRTPIMELAGRLDPARWVQVHRSTIVNLDRVAGARRDELSRVWLRLHGWEGELPVSRAYVHRFKPM